MKAWYSSEQAARLSKRANLCKWLVIGLLAAALGGCIFLCTQVRTGNASRLLGATIALSTLGGWVALLLISFVQRPAKAGAGHVRGLLDAPEETHTGQLTISKEGFQIPGSIVVRKAKLQTPEETHTLNLNARFASRMPAPGTTVKVTVKKKFIIAVEVVG